MQNPYNNFLKRQKNGATNNFKEKVANSLSGKTLNNTSMPNTSNNINKYARSTVQSPTSPSNKLQVNNNINTQQTITTPPTTQKTPQNTIVNTVANPITTQTTNQTINPTPNEVSQNVNTSVVQNTQNNVSEAPTGQGMMSLEDINKTMSVINNPVTNPYVRTTGSSNQSSSNTNSSTNYKDLLEQNKKQELEQLEKDWQLQQQANQQKQDALKAEYAQSVKDAENAYTDTVNGLNEQRYNQMEDLAVSATNRGIQYSPQALGLENVVNINHNKNLTQASKTRNELLNKLQLQLNSSLADLSLSFANSQNEYNKNKLNINTNYNNTLSDWLREDEKTQSERDWEQKLLEEKRAWEEAQALKDKEWEKQMQELQNKFEQEMQNSQNSWQSGENKLDREHETALSKSRSTGGGYSSYSGGSGYDGYSSKSYTPYYNGYDSYADAASLDDEIIQQATDNNFKLLSTDAYNAVDTGGVSDLYERADLYNELISGIYDEYYGLNDVVDERLDNTRSTALKHLLNKSYARSTNGSYQIGDTVYTHNSPLRQSYIDKVKKTQAQDREKYYEKYNVKRDELTKLKMKTNANAEKIHNKIMDNIKSNTTSSTKTSTRKTNTTQTQKKVAKAVSNSAKNVKTSTTNATKNAKTSGTKATNNAKKATTNASKNVKKSTTNAKNNTKKAVSNSKKNTKKSTSNAVKNLKKSISKLFGK